MEENTWMFLGISLLGNLIIMVTVTILYVKLRKRKDDKALVKRKCYQCGNQIVYADTSKPGNHYECPKCGHAWESKY